MLRSIAIIAFFATTRFASAETFAIKDEGAVRSFEVATDELGSIGRDGRGSLIKATAQQHADARRNGRDLVLYEKGRPHNEFTRRWLTARVLVKLAPGADAAALAKEIGAVRVEQPDFAPGYAIFDAPAGALTLVDLLRKKAGVESAEPLLARQGKKRFIPTDPLFSDNVANVGYQWHLRNVGTRGGTAGIDLNITTAWDTVRGAGVKIGIVDDGLDILHPDLAANVDATASHDFNDGDADPSPSTAADIHGTSVAGLAAARANNASGGSGVAPESTLAGLRLLGGPQTDAGDAAAFAWRNDIIAIKSNSWGPDDDGATLGGPGTLASAALQSAVATGRGGKGTVFCWAGGNGGTGDNSNFDGYANSPYVLTFGAITDAGTQAPYSESGANLTASVPSDGGAQLITTTDVRALAGYNNGHTAGNFPDGDFTNDFGGTSAAAPLASGIAALVLQTNPALGWRDVQEILIRSARKNAPTDSDWANNGAGIHFNHKFGAGLLDATAAVTLATDWVNLGPLTTLRKLDVIPANIPDAPSTGLSRTFTFAASDGLRVEKAALTVSLTHAARGTLEVDLTSPSGMVSHLATTRALDTGANLDWTFSTARHWGESAVGTWTVTVRDTLIGDVGVLNRLTLELHGSAPTGTSAPIINSGTTASGNAGSAFGFRITASNAPTSFAATGLPAGLSINALTGLISGTGTTSGNYAVGVSATNTFGTANSTLTITLGSNLVAAIADAIDQPALTWELDLANVWARVTGTAPAVTHDGTDAARTPTITDNGSTSFSTIIVGPQVIRFFWKVSSEANYDILHFALDDVDQATLSGNVDWQQRGFLIPAGAHALRWTYDKDVSGSAGSDAAWVDQITLTPFATSLPVFTIEPTPITVAVGGTAAFISKADGPGTITYQWQRNAANIVGATSRTYTFTAATAGTYTCLATNSLGTTTSLPAILTVATADTNIQNAVDNTLIWAKTGSFPQFSRIASTSSVNTHDAVDSAIATGLIAGSDTTISTTVVGPGTLTFWWRSDGTVDSDVLGFNLDGIETDYITNTGAFLQNTQSIPAGIHTISWTFYAGTGTGRGIVDQVAFALTPYGTWQAAKFTTAQRIDSLISGPTADPDADGIPNITEQYFGTLPTAPTVAPTTIAYEAPNYTFTYKKDTSASTIARTIEHTTDLYNWTPVTATESILSTVGTVQTVKATLPSVTGGQHTYRLRLELSE